MQAGRLQRCTWQCSGGALTLPVARGVMSVVDVRFIHHTTVHGAATGGRA